MDLSRVVSMQSCVQYPYSHRSLNLMWGLSCLEMSVVSFSSTLHSIKLTMFVLDERVKIDMLRVLFYNSSQDPDN